MKSFFKKVLMFPLLFLTTMVVDANITTKVNASENVKQAYSAMKIASGLGEADGIKDDAYNSTTPIPISVVTHDNGNTAPATANMYLLWDNSYIYMFAEVVDTKHYQYDSNSWLETRDAFEMMLDLYHKADYWINGYGGEYRDEFYGTKARMCEGLYKIAAGVNKATVDTHIQGTHWMYDDQKNNGSYYSCLTQTGYTVEMKISVGQDADRFLKTGREIGVGVKIYDKYSDEGNSSVTTLEEKNDRQLEGPRYLSNVVLVENSSQIPFYREEVTLQGRDGYVANKTSEFIIADGVKEGAWDDAKAIDLVYARQFANENIGRMTIYMLWDESYFYFYADIKDNTVNVCPSDDIFNYCNYDAVGFCLDLLRDTTVANFDTGNYQTSVGFGGDYRNDKMCEGFWALTRGAKDLTIGTHWMCDDSTTKAASTFASISNDEGYSVEMKIYAGNNKEEFMQEGRKIGVGLNVSDQFVTNGNTSNTVSQAVLDQKNFPNNDRAWGKVWAQGPCALSEVTLNGYATDSSFESDNVDRKEFNASRVLSDTKIKVDGVMDELYSTTSEIEINTLVSGTTNASAKAKVMWTKGYVYVFVDVKDSTLSQVQMPNTSDGVIVAIDLLGDNSNRTNRWGSDATKGGEGIFVANPGQRLFGYGTKYLYDRYLSRVASIVNEDKTGYTVEMRIEIGNNTNNVGDNIGLAIAVQDNSDNTNNIINGMVATNTQQNRVFSYNGVLDTVKLIANASETKTEVNDADSMDYVPSVDKDNKDDEIIETPDISESITPSETPSVDKVDDGELKQEKGCNGSVCSSLYALIALLALFGIKLIRKKN